MAGVFALGGLASALASAHVLAQGASPFLQPGGGLLQPSLILLFCVIAGFATVLLLPGRHDYVVRRIGGTVLIVAALIFGAFIIKATVATGERLHIYFWIFATVALVSAVRVITHPRPVYSALYFVLTVFASAGLFVLLWAEFMAAALVLIYAGAILITYVFVIMLATQASAPGASATVQLTEYDAISREPLMAAIVGFALMGVLLFVIFDCLPASAVPAPGNEPVRQELQVNSDTGAVQQLGVYLFNDQILNLELAGMILTISMVGAILIARRKVYIVEPLSPVKEVIVAAATPVDDNPHSIPVYGTLNPRQKEYPET